MSLRIRIPVTLVYLEAGQELTQPAQTVWIAPREAELQVARPIAADTLVELRRVAAGKRCRMRVLSCRPDSSSGHRLLVRMEPSEEPHFWPVYFPPATV